MSESMSESEILSELWKILLPDGDPEDQQFMLDWARRMRADVRKLRQENKQLKAALAQARLRIEAAEKTE